MASSELPHDLAFEILTRTCLETLDACSKFISMDGCSGKYSFSHLPVETLKTKDRFFNCYDSNMKIEASSRQGILCCMRPTRNNNYRYYICKPRTQEWKVLPNPKLRYWIVQVALVVFKSDPLHFKTLHLSKDSPTGSSYPSFECLFKYRNLGFGNYFCEIFDSKTNAWRQGNIISLSEDVCLKYHHQPINASGLLYLVTTDDQVLILNYDGEEAYPRFYLLEQLGFICLSPSEILELWCIENTINHVWRKEQKVETENIKRVMNYPSPIDFYYNDVIVMEGSNGSVFYKQQNASLHLVNSDKLYCPIEVFLFVRM
ncbi:hypothetical protein H5410_059969 [Solanum commersonii]|uniref:F-box associated domain-containing protein n=1 Tax=Solanum commersonii TaxID=4109 RepID=A0A9J5W3T9_SOLCO|nr:hypothetical protein H5410_059969 [Solanum commersonii]